MSFTSRTADVFQRFITGLPTSWRGGEEKQRDTAAGTPIMFATFFSPRRSAAPRRFRMRIRRYTAKKITVLLFYASGVNEEGYQSQRRGRPGMSASVVENTIKMGCDRRMREVGYHGTRSGEEARWLRYGRGMPVAGVGEVAGGRGVARATTAIVIFVGILPFFSAFARL